MICFHVPRRNSMRPGKRHLVINDSLLKLKKNKFLVTPLLTLSSILTWKPCSLYGKYVCHHRIKRQQQAKFNNYVETLIISNHISSCSPKSKIKCQFSKSLQDGLGFQFEWAGILIIALTFSGLDVQIGDFWHKHKGFESRLWPFFFSCSYPSLNHRGIFLEFDQKEKVKGLFRFTHTTSNTLSRNNELHKPLFTLTIPHWTNVNALISM